MKIFKLSSLGVLTAVALAVSYGLARADDSSYGPRQSHDMNQQNQQNQQKQEPGIVPDTASDTTGGAIDSLKDNPQAKMSVGPHSLMVQSSLMSSKDMVDGMKSQLDLAQSAHPSGEFFEHMKMYDKAIGADLKTAKAHETELKGSLQKYPNVAKTDQVQKLDFAVNDVNTFFGTWSDKSKSNNYWLNTTQAKNDLDALSKKIDAAIDQSKKFNSDQLDISIG